MYAGNGREVDVLANDTDADSPEDLTVCRLGEETYKTVFAESFGDGVIFTYSLPGAKPGTYTFTYYACDFQALVPGTLTVTIEPEPEVTAKALPGQPGKIKVTNPADFKIRYLYGSFKEPEPDGIVKIAKNSSVVLSVRRTQIDWIAYTRKGDFITQGRIKNIGCPRAPPHPRRQVGVAAGRQVSGRPPCYSAYCSAKASGGGQAQTRLRSPYAWSMRATGGQYLSGSGPVGNTASSRE